MTRLVSVLSAIMLSLFLQVAYAQQEIQQEAEQGVERIAEQSTESKLAAPEQTPEVGKHVMANMDAGSMIVSLLMVLAIIIISALVLKRFNITQQNTSQLKVVASLSLGAKERVVIVQIAEQQLVLGVTASQITLIENLEEPLQINSESALPMAGNVLNFLKKASNQPSKLKEN